MAPKLTRLDRQWDQARAELFEWIRLNTKGPGEVPGEMSADRGEAIVAEIGMSPQVLLYTGRPTVLNSQFENVEIRDRYEEYLQAIFSPEEMNLATFFRKYEATYLLLNRDWAVGCNIARLHFLPEELDQFFPVFENDHYRLYRFSDTVENDSRPNWNRRWSKWWNLENYQVENGHLIDSSNDRRQLTEFHNLFVSLPRQLGQLADSFERAWRQRNPEQKTRIDLLQIQRDLAEARYHLAVAGPDSALETRLDHLERTAVARLAEKSPLSELTLQEELVRILNGQPDKDDEGVLKKLGRLKASPEEYAVVGQMLMLLGEFELAGEMFGTGGSIHAKPALTEDPHGPRPSEYQEYLWRETILNLVAGGKKTRAGGLARFCTNHVAPGSQNLDFFVRAGNMDLD